MASVVRETRNGRSLFRVQFFDKENKRRSIRLGQVNRKAAQTVATRVESIVSSAIMGTPLDRETSQWLTVIGQDLADKLAAAGLAAKRETSTLAGFLDAYIASREDAKPNTIRNLKYSRERLVEYFGADKPLHGIKSGDADEWRQKLVNDGFAEATISKVVKNAKQFFRLAERKGLIRGNPFQELKAAGERNDARLAFVDRPTVAKLLDAAPDARWRLIIALARYGGLRTPSETLTLRWCDVDWENNRLTVPSPKTERHGKAYRVVPLFPELRPYLADAFDEAETGSVYCVSGYSSPADATNLRTQLLRIIRRAGLQPWERLFHNLRASRQTELADQFPAHVVADWLGNSPQVAERHYLQTVESHFQRAIERQGVVQEVVQQSPGMAGNGPQKEKAALRKGDACTGFPAIADACGFEQYPRQESNL